MINLQGGRSAVAYRSKLKDLDVYFVVVQKSQAEVMSIMGEHGNDRIAFRNAMFDVSPTS